MEMKGNEKIAFTAEAVALMRAKKRVDPFSKYFVSVGTEKRFEMFSKVIPKNSLERIFVKRINLSKELDKMIKLYCPEQIVELACGYSTRGLVRTRKSGRLVYVETDFSSAINRKKKILAENNVGVGKNHHFVVVDVIKDDLWKSVCKFVDRKKKTLVVAETLTSYLNREEHEFLVKNVKRFLGHFREGAYLSHEGLNMLKGVFGKLLLFYRNVVGKTKSHRHFYTSDDVRKYFSKKGFGEAKVKVVEGISQMLYLVKI